MKKLSGLLLVALFLSLGSASAHAANLNGWAWSETFGWISFNSANPGAGGGPYAVSVNSSGDWSGWAWSENLGWISFNASDVSPCGAAGHLNTANGAVTGFARAVVYPGNEGCIELSGPLHTSPVQDGSGGITYDPTSGNFMGYAWGGDTVKKTGPGWIYFYSPSPVSCQHADCGYGSVAGTCTAIDPYQNIQPGNVRFEAAATSPGGPFDYAWNPLNPPTNWNEENPDYRYGRYFATSGPGPTVKIRSGSSISSLITCPSVTVIVPVGQSDLRIGRTVSTATLASLTVKQGNGFALAWGPFVMTNNYSCSPSVTASDGSNPGYQNWSSNWSGNLGMQNNNNGTKTWSGNTGSSLIGGAAPGIYQFKITCTANNNPTQIVSVQLKINSSTESEI